MPIFPRTGKYFPKIRLEGRKSHFLRRNPQSNVPERLLFIHVDAIETFKAKQGSPRGADTSLGDGLSALGIPGEKGNLCFGEGLGYLCSFNLEDGLVVQEQFALDSEGAFWSEVLSRIGEKEHLWVIGEQLGVTIRLVSAIAAIASLGWTGDRLYAGDSCLFLAFRQGHRKVKFLESENIWRMGLGELERLSGAKKPLERQHQDASTLALERCKHALAVLTNAWESYLGFLLEHDLGHFAITISSQALNAFRHKFMRHEIGISSDATQAKVERAAYHGGRCQVFQQGTFENGPYYKLDINGAYAWAMGKFDYPVRCTLHSRAYSVSVLEELVQDNLVIAEVILDTDVPAYPVKLGKRLLYPVGIFKTTLSTPELKRALADGHVKAMGRVQLYAPEKVFADYVAFFTIKRLEFQRAGNRVWETLCKRFLNTLYGKFGQRGYSEKVIGEAPPNVVSATRMLDADTGFWAWKYTFAGKIVVERRSEESQNSFPAIPAHVTAYLRSYLYDLMERAGKENVFYADTDALVVNQAGYDNLADFLHPTEPGKLKVEGQGSTLTVWAKKWYSIGGEITTAGVKGSAIRIGRTRFVQQEVESLRSSLVAQDGRTVKTSWVRKRFRGKTPSPMTTDNRQVKTPCLSMTLERLTSIIVPDKEHTDGSWWVDPLWLISQTRDRLDAEGVLVLDNPEVEWTPRPVSKKTVFVPTDVVCYVNGREFYKLETAINFGIGG